MPRFPYFARAILLGLFTTQIIATLQVYLSNIRLYHTLATITEAGYLPIPNQRVMPTLNEFGSAFYGGVFFTLSLGAGLSLFSVAGAWIWGHIFGRSRALLVPVVLLWLGAIVLVNMEGFDLLVALYFLAVPLLVFVSALKWMPKKKEYKVWLNRLAHLLPIGMLTLIWSVYADHYLFVDIRDYLLLSNSFGQKVDDFYYRYTLYPAEVFKPLEQKALKTCALPPIEDRAVARRMERVLISDDYLPVSTDAPVDLKIAESEHALLFKHKDKAILHSTFKEFFSQPKEVLKNFSGKIDRHKPFRQATFIGLLVAFPILLYVMVFAVLRFAVGFLVGPTPSSVITGALCFLVGLALLAPLRIGRPNPVEISTIPEAMASESWQQRVIALRTAVSKKVDISNYNAYPNMLSSPHTPERYWLAKALGVSKDPKTYDDLLALLDDPHPNVVSMAFQALGQRGDRRAVEEILRRIDVSDHWYNQWYAYKALRELGWRQSPVEGP